MYLPAQFEESRSEVLRALMAEHPFATLVTQGDEGLTANHLPLHLEPGIGAFGALQGHVARALNASRQSPPADPAPPGFCASRWRTMRHCEARSWVLRAVAISLPRQMVS